MKYIPIIGLEIHAELATQSKMFCGCPANFFGTSPNSQTCPVCLGLPGALPVPNKKAIEWCILIGKALNCTIPPISKFDRKHYFYPDLPKGYQISQYDEPMAVNGNFQFSVFNFQKKKSIKITRVHLEEDTGKLIHSGGDTLVDFNRSGVPLVEIVTEPDFDNAEDVKKFLEELHTIIRYLGVSDADMEKGSMRLEPNISLKEVGQKDLPNYKVEVKNINSFRFVKQAIEYELERQKELLESGETPIQETRGYDEKKGITYSQRSKEEAHDYRYFPEPDIPPMKLSKKYVASIKVPELPQEKMARFIQKGIKEQDAFIVTRDKAEVEKIENAALKISLADTITIKDIVTISINKKESGNWTPEQLYLEAKKRKQPIQTDQKSLEDSINSIIETNKKVVEDYKNGKENAIMFLVGQVMREMKGKADAKIVIEKLKERLK